MLLAFSQIPDIWKNYNCQPSVYNASIVLLHLKTQAMFKPDQQKHSSAAIFDEQKAELDQARLRLFHVPIGIAYGHFSGLNTSLPPDIRMPLLIYASCFALYVLLSFLYIRHSPGIYPVRRVINMVGDYGSLTAILILGENIAMPFFALILWATLGNGMRYGQRYLFIAAILAQMSLLALLIASPYWRSQVEIMVTFSLSAIALPTYALLLLRETTKARDAALAATLAKSRFLAQASHDLRQPIHAIGYFISALRSSYSSPEQIQLVDRVERALGGVSRLFKSLLDVAKLDSGTIDIRPEPVALRPLIADLINTNEQFIQWNDVKMRSVVADVTVVIDPTLLSTMIQNLLSNAIKYSKGRKVLIGTRQRGSSISLEIYDQGVGIESEHLPRVFDEFYRAHAPGDHDSEGVGLGLAILQRLATLCDLLIKLDSKRGVGTSAKLSGLIVSEMGAIAPAKNAFDAYQPLADIRVVLIEDDTDVLEATAGLLKRWGCVVQTFSKIPSEVSDADVIVSDFDLGFGATGTLAIDSVRLQLGRTVPAILMTGHSEADVRDRIVAEETILLMKPVNPATLRSTLSTIRLGRFN